MEEPREYKGRDRELAKGVYLIPSTGRYKATVWEKTTGKHNHLGVFATPEEAKYARVCAKGNHWEGVVHDPIGSWGFIYCITNNLTGKLYIGKKQYRLWDGPPGGYKCTDPNNTEWFDEDTWRANDWIFYTGSCNELNWDVEKYGIHNFTYEVLSLEQDKLDLHLAEVHEQMERDVLEAVDGDGEYLYYNRNIASLEFRAPFKKEEMKKMSLRTAREAKRYYLKPLFCKKCKQMIPYGYKECECNAK